MQLIRRLKYAVNFIAFRKRYFSPPVADSDRNFSLVSITTILQQATVLACPCALHAAHFQVEAL
jgi:hypothetical protein